MIYLFELLLDWIGDAATKKTLDELREIVVRLPRLSIAIGVYSGLGRGCRFSDNRRFALDVSPVCKLTWRSKLLFGRRPERLTDLEESLLKGDV